MTSPTGEATSDQLAAIWADLEAARRNAGADGIFDASVSRRVSSLAWRLGAFMAFVDICSVMFAFALAIPLADATRWLLGMESLSSFWFVMNRWQEMTLLIALTVGVFAFGGLYRRTGWELSEVRKIVAAVALIAMFDATIQFIVMDHESRLWFLFAYPLAAVTLVSARMFVRSVPQVKAAMTSHVVLIGKGVTPDGFVHELRESRAGNVRLLSAAPLSKYDGVDPAGMTRHLSALARQAGVGHHKLTTVIAPTPWELSEAQNVLASLNKARLPYSVVLPFRGLARSGLDLQEVVGADLVLAEMTPTKSDTLARILKRIVDILGAAVLLTLLSPIFLVVAGLLSLEKGPVFFRQKRVGRGDTRFDCVKFRTMRPDAEERLKELLANDTRARAEWDTYQKLSEDPRITRLGRVLRSTSLDELPQLWNVLIGEMSLVGPRPIVAPEVECYGSDRAYYNHPDFSFYARCTPGITGLWQVSGRASTTHGERVRLDRWYARNWSLWLDVYVLFKTIGVVLARTGSR